MAGGGGPHPRSRRAAAAAAASSSSSSSPPGSPSAAHVVPRPIPIPRPLSHASFLTVGQTFSGSQTVNNPTSTSHAKDSDEWRVNVLIQGIDLRNGTVCGFMEALDVPKADSPVVTFWTGEIIDNSNYFFRTRRWGAQMKQDVDHWNQFTAFAPIHDNVASDTADHMDVSQLRYIFMRWKEIFFVSPDEGCGLTIAGFYYVCMDRHTGAVLGYYYDPQCQPYQRLQLNAISAQHGQAFADYEFN